MKIYQVDTNINKCHFFECHYLDRINEDIVGLKGSNYESLVEYWQGFNNISYNPATYATYFIGSPVHFAKLAIEQQYALPLLEDLDKYQISYELLPFDYQNYHFYVLYLREHLRVDHYIEHRKTNPIRTVRSVDFTKYNLQEIKPLFEATNKPKTVQTEMYCTEEFIDIVRRHNLTGLQFRLAWSDEGLEPEFDFKFIPPLTKEMKSGITSNRRPTKRDKFIAMLWDGINKIGTPDWLGVGKEVADPADWIEGLLEPTRMFRIMQERALTAEEARRTMQGLAYSLLFDLTIECDERGLCSDKKLHGLHESILADRPPLGDAE